MLQPLPPSPTLTPCPNTHFFHFTHFAILPPAHLSCQSLLFLIHNMRIVQSVISAFIYLLQHLHSCSLSLRASRECQNKERLLEQRFRAALRDFQQWLVNAKISTAKCFDVPQNVAEVSNALQRITVRNIFSSHEILLSDIFENLCKFQPNGFSLNHFIAACDIACLLLGTRRYPRIETSQ